MSCYPLAETFTLMLQGAPHTTPVLSYPANTTFNTRHTQWTHRLQDDLNDDLARDSSNNSHCHPLVDDLPIPFCHLLQTVMLPLHRSPFWSGFLAQSLLEIVTHLVHCLPCLCNFVCPYTGNGPMLSLVICSYHLSFRSFKQAAESEMRRRLHFCRGNKIFRTPCTRSLCWHFSLFMTSKT